MCWVTRVLWRGGRLRCVCVCVPEPASFFRPLLQLDHDDIFLRWRLRTILHKKLKVWSLPIFHTTASHLLLTRPNCQKDGFARPGSERTDEVVMTAPDVRSLRHQPPSTVFDFVLHCPGFVILIEPLCCMRHGLVQFKFRSGFSTPPPTPDRFGMPDYLNSGRMPSRAYMLRLSRAVPPTMTVCRK